MNATPGLVTEDCRAGPTKMLYRGVGVEDDPEYDHVYTAAGMA